MKLTRMQRAADAYLRQRGTDLATFLAVRAQLDVPGAAIARQLREETAGVIDVTDQTIREWIRHLDVDRRAGAA